MSSRQFSSWQPPALPVVFLGSKLVGARWKRSVQRYRPIDTCSVTRLELPCLNPPRIHAPRAVHSPLSQWETQYDSIVDRVAASLRTGVEARLAVARSMANVFVLPPAGSGLPGLLRPDFNVRESIGILF